ncbi:hypothetical protein HFN89_04045 [Rhizobium laguerreae]|nr:hypothetical protein [Rhizobium laguerreae]
MSSPKSGLFSFRKIVAVIVLGAAAYGLAVPIGNIKAVRGVYRGVLGNGFYAVCPRRDSDIYRLVYMPKSTYTLGTWASMIWYGPPLYPKSLAFSVKPIPLMDDIAASNRTLGPVEIYREIGFQVTGSDNDVLVSMTFNGRPFAITGFWVSDGDSPSALNLRQVAKNLSAFADIIHHCSATN